LYQHRSAVQAFRESTLQRTLQLRRGEEAHGRRPECVVERLHTGLFAHGFIRDYEVNPVHRDLREQVLERAFVADETYLSRH